jgi:hypothetical protein
MKTSLLITVLVAVLASGALAASSSTTDVQSKLVLYGHVKSVTHTSRGYRLRFDPAWWLTGSAAEHACGCKPVANDYFVVDETHRLLDFPVSGAARVTVLVRGATVSTASISVAELAQIVAGKNPRHRQLLEPKAGFWIRVSQKYPSPITSLEQQYQP